MEIAGIIKSGKTALGIEFGSTRIKSVLINEHGDVLAKGSHDWENQLIDGLWTYSLEDIWKGLQNCYSKLAGDVLSKYGITLKKVGSIGISGMMHGYMPFDKDGNLLTSFRTWRNTNTAVAAEKLTEFLDFNMPQRWSVSHLYQAVLDKEADVEKIDYLATLAAYIHWQLTGEKVAGVGEASGMFPINSETNDYDSVMIDKVDALLSENDVSLKLRDILPKVLVAGEKAGTLTTEGAKLLDPSGNLESGILMCPPEGDAGTGMVATNSVKTSTGNISAGTSVFAMVVLEKPLSQMYPEIDIVTTPTGKTVAMVHCNNCTSELNSWINLFAEYNKAMGFEIPIDKIYQAMFKKALEGNADCDGILVYNYHSGEQITGFAEGRPLFVRKPDSDFSIENFMRAQLYSCIASLRIGMDILTNEKVKLTKMLGHGGYFKTEKVGQTFMASALDVPISVMSTADEGGAWGMALLALFAQNPINSLDKFLEESIFADKPCSEEKPDPNTTDGFLKFMENYKAGLVIEKSAVNALK